MFPEPQVPGCRVRSTLPKSDKRNGNREGLRLMHVESDGFLAHDSICFLSFFVRDNAEKGQRREQRQKQTLHRFLTRSRPPLPRTRHTDPSS